MMKLEIFFQVLKSSVSDHHQKKYISIVQNVWYWYYDEIFDNLLCFKMYIDCLFSYLC